MRGPTPAVRYGQHRFQANSAGLRLGDSEKLERRGRHVAGGARTGNDQRRGKVRGAAGAARLPACTGCRGMVRPSGYGPPRVCPYPRGVREQVPSGASRATHLRAPTPLRLDSRRERRTPPGRSGYRLPVPNPSPGTPARVANRLPGGTHPDGCPPAPVCATARGWLLGQREPLATALFIGERTAQIKLRELAAYLFGPEVADSVRLLKAVALRSDRGALFIDFEASIP